MATKRTAIIYSKKFLEACKTLPISIDKAIIFGSTVQDKATKDSDIDLAIFSKSFSNNLFQNIDLIGKVLIQFPELDIHPYPTKSYDKKGILLDEIRNNGIALSV